MTAASDLIIFWTIVSLRILIPLTIPRYPLPGIIASLVLDAIDQTLFQSLTNFQLDGYQGYDKALDIYYLAIAYIATLRNWSNQWAVRISRFLFYYRLVGVVLFELTQFRWLLLLFPNVFEYFFIFYEVVRLRWDPRRLSGAVLAGVAAAIWIVIKLPQEYWIHVAQLDVTDMVKQNLLGYPETADWGAIFSERAGLFILFFAGVALAIYFIWRWLRSKLPPADWALSFTPDAHLARIPEVDLRSTTRALAAHFLDRELFEKTALVSLLVIIFAQILPGIRSSNLELALAMTIVIVVNTVVSETLVRRGVAWPHALRQGLVMVAVNLPVMLIVSLVRYGSIPLLALNNIVVFILLLSLIITLYDRYRPIYLTRFSDGY
ncbi:MAG: hypothetical protein GWP61_18990 [Chloroflexi bacterium]|jgi:hypothetical protein|nr:hypothetical protein [Chloroflexota bacterium]